jgi:hypothetical protein
MDCKARFATPKPGRWAKSLRRKPPHKKICHAKEAFADHRKVCKTCCGVANLGVDRLQSAFCNAKAWTMGKKSNAAARQDATGSSGFSDLPFSTPK